MFSSYFRSSRWAAWAYLGLFLIVFSIWLQTKIIVAINVWYKDFYDMAQEITKHTLQEFWQSIFKFLTLAMPYVLIITITNFFASHWIFRWRKALTFSYMDQWKKCKQDIEGSSQRIQEDIFRLAKIYESLGIDFIRALMLLVSFIPVLKELGYKLPIEFLANIPYSLVIIAFLISLGGMVISWFVGIKLPKLEYNIQKTEAAFRKELVFAEDNKIDYAKPATIGSLFSKLSSSYYRLYLHYGYFNIWLYSFNQFMVIFPYILVGPGLFTGAVTLGVLMQISDAFSRVRSSFSVFIDNWTTITELRSIFLRLKEFEQNINYQPVRDF